MKIAVLSITQAGQRLSEHLSQSLGAEHAVTRYAFAGYAGADVQPFQKTDDLMRAHFREYDAWICICACGIAVRAIAPYIVSKQTDPAVVVIDDQARFAIPVLSGHVGGANALSRQIARLIGAQAVVTTATDVGGRFSPDSFAAANELIITDFTAAKKIAAAVLSGEKIGIMSEYPVTGLPAECAVIQASAGPDEDHGTVGSGSKCRRQNCTDYRTGIYIGLDPGCRPFDVTLPLIPKNIVLGIGCRRGISAGTIAKHVREALRSETLLQRVCAVATIDRKADEPGLAAYCEQLGVPLVTYTAQQLQEAGPPAAQGEETVFASSEFVRQAVGVDNVCERSAVLCSGGALILPKTAGDGVTTAAAEKPVCLDGRREVCI